jgi:predicted Zn-dependent protease
MYQRAYPQSYQRRQSGGLGVRLLIGLALAAFAIISFLGSRQYNPIIGEDQYLSLTTDQEIVLGLQAVPEIYQEIGREYNDPELQALVDQIGADLVNNSIARDTPWEWDFHVLDNAEMVNAFALPGGQIFITTGLLEVLESQEQLAAVLGHEMVHVLARHSAQQIAKSDLTNGLINAVAVASQSASAAQTAQIIGQMVNMSYGRDDEHQSDIIGVCILISAGYNPQAMAEVMQILAQASGGGGQPEFLSTHPSSENRISQIQNAIDNADTNCQFG